MKYYCHLTFWLIVLWRICSLHAQSTSYYKRTYYSAAAPSTRHYYTNSRSIIKPSNGDLVPQESRYKERGPTKSYKKPIPARPYLSEEDEFSHEQFLSSAEYSNESPTYGTYSNENDSKELAIGTQIRVHHPITASKQNPYITPTKKQRKPYTPSELHLEPTKKRTHKYSGFDADPFHVIPPPKPSAAALTFKNNYNVYEDEQEDTKDNRYDRFKGVPSKKQIDKYLEDQQKYLDESLKAQLIKNSKYHKYLTIDDNENERDLYDTEYKFNNSPNTRGKYSEHLSFKTNRPRRRPQTSELRLSPKRVPNRKYRSAIVINV